MGLRKYLSPMREILLPPELFGNYTASGFRDVAAALMPRNRGCGKQPANAEDQSRDRAGAATASA